MIYSFTQLSHYLTCPRRYRYRYVDGWHERDNRAGLLFGRAFENAVAAMFQRRNARTVFLEEWAAYENQPLNYSRGDNWKTYGAQGIKLLDFFAGQDRVEIRYPKRNLQVRVSKKLSATAAFVGYIDAYGFLDGRRCLIDWKTSGARFPEEPSGLLALDPQLACYSWLTGEPEVAFVVFVRKRMPEVQYLRCTITEQQRREFGELVQDTISQIEAGMFAAHPGIRFPQNPCSCCSFVGLCLNDDRLTDKKLMRDGGGDRGWLDELEY